MRLASCEVRVEGVWGVLFSCRSLPDGEDGDSLSLRSGLEGNDLVDYGDLDYADYVARRGVSRLMPWMDGLCVYLLLVWVSCDSDEDVEWPELRFFRRGIPKKSCLARILTIV
ncbi:uncharacterized protein N7518_002905 [Penicillium psychrosexuale]|uniref:uncharacterized protein n=1 Tax=Penicillium psychrosexuale TaxID=1002107 RepID=UPI002545AE13|nr:uncharacterized protein N7518_002905 [Penicillium psychrosexuale]KAJ5800837.1 hypothetical protein N7518_002905 [Penicillium psychrosexuale]